MPFRGPFPFFLLLTAATLAEATPATSTTTPDGSAVVVEHHAPRLTVRISSAMDLRSVLDVVCREASANCRIVPGVPAGTVAPTTVSGTWLDVIGALLQGSDLRYAATPAVPGLPAQLVIEDQTAVRTVGEIPSGARANAGSVIDHATQTVTSPAVSPNPDAEPAESMPADVAADVPASSLVSGGPSGGAEMLASMSTTVPFPGAGGFPVRVRGDGPTAPGQAPWVGAPFPDPSGNPLPMAPPSAPGASVVPSGAPFPDPQGNPFPVSLPGAGAGQPNGLNPFPDPNGAPIVSPTPPPAQDHD
jgi:hypothetical protein